MKENRALIPVVCQLQRSRTSLQWSWFNHETCLVLKKLPIGKVAQNKTHPIVGIKIAHSHQANSKQIVQVNWIQIHSHWNQEFVQNANMFRSRRIVTSFLPPWWLTHFVSWLRSWSRSYFRSELCALTSDRSLLTSSGQPEAKQIRGAFRCPAQFSVKWKLVFALEWGDFFLGGGGA